MIKILIDEIQTYKITGLDDVQIENFSSNCESGGSDDKVESTLESNQTNEIIEDDNSMMTDNLMKEEIIDNLLKRKNVVDDDGT